MSKQDTQCPKTATIKPIKYQEHAMYHHQHHLLQHQQQQRHAQHHHYYHYFATFTITALNTSKM